MEAPYTVFVFLSVCKRSSVSDPFSMGCPRLMPHLNDADADAISAARYAAVRSGDYVMRDCAAAVSLLYQSSHLI